MSSSNGISDEKSQSGGDAVDKHVEQPKLELLKLHRKAVTWKFENQRRLFLEAFGDIIRDWREPLPNLRDFITNEEMDWLLVESMKPESPNLEIVDFVARSGYRDEPDSDKEGRPVLRRTTAVHKIAECHRAASKIDLLRKLFCIYNKFHVNYTDDSGYTHFHMACMYNLKDVAEKFLEVGQVDPNCLVPETGNSLLCFVAGPIIGLLLKHGADPNHTNEDASTPLHGICKIRSRHYPEVRKLLESCDELERTVLIDAQDKRGDTPLLLATKKCNDIRTVGELLRRGANPNLANEDGATCLHVICQKDYCGFKLLQQFFKFTDEFERKVELDIRDKEGNAPLHLALKDELSKLYLYNAGPRKNEEIVLELLRRGADPNTINAKGQTPLHVICQKYNNRSLSRSFFNVNDEIRKTVQLDIQDNEGNTPLHLATLCESEDMIESLLRLGADPNVANAKGLTPLHIVCRSDHACRLFKLFFRVVDEIKRTIRLDARDNEGNTTLHLVTAGEKARMIESLLSRGADPCLANARGLTPLLMTASRDAHGSTMQLFLDATNGDGMQQQQQQRWAGIDARDPQLGRTELEWLVTRCWPLAVKSLLDRGADVSSFVFPTPSDCDRYGDVNPDLFDPDDEDFIGRDCSLAKLIAATGLLAIVELLETRGYAMDRDDALKFMGFFAKYEFCGSRNFPTSQVVDYLADSLFQEMAKNPTYIDFFKFSHDMRKHPREYTEACSLPLCERVSAKFFRDWALDPFMELIHYRLPTECGEMIIAQLTNKDLYNICLAAAGNSS